jgi:hypothetical protein
MSRKVMLVKKNRAPSAKPLGVNPMDPWSAKANISEASEKELLHRFLKSKGINPIFVSTDTKIAHSKSGEFIKWRRDHDFQEQIEPEILKQMIDEGVFTDDESIAKHLVKKYGKNVDAHQIRLAHHFHPEKHKTTPERIAGHVNRLLGKPVTEGKSPRLTSLDKFRQAAAEREKKHNEIEKQMKARHAAGKEDMKGSIDRLEKHLNKEESEVNEADQKFIDSLNKLAKTHKVGDSVTVNSKFFGKQKGKVTKVDNQSVHVVRDGKSSSEKYPHDAVVKEEVVTEKNDSHTHAAHYEDPKTGEWTGMNLLIAKDDEDAIRQANEKCKEGCRLTKVERHITVKEEVEQIDEISKSTLDSYKDKSSASLKNAKMNRDAAEPGKNMSKSFADLHAKSNAIAKKRVKGLMGYLQRKQGVKPMGEDVYQDAQAATQTAFDMGTTPNQTEPTSSRRSEMSKSARIIKSLYKKHKMVKEEMYDHEKEDKSVQTYGKKPKMAATDKKDSFGENKPDAAAIMSGGTTLTGGKRDDVEIDPMMRNKPGQNVFNKEFGKKGS